MCGIAGIIDFSEKPEKRIVDAMCEDLKQRGPDFGAVQRLDRYAVFGHRRLSILDLSEKANQPLSDQSGRYTIVYNGEVYNYRELRHELEGKGYRFVTSGDTEVVLAAYIQWGVKCFERFNGMFALVIWDNHLKIGILARDRFGKKPLYYHTGCKRCSFASTLNALLQDPVCAPERKFSLPALNQFFALGYILHPHTLYESIFKLPPASYAFFSGNGFKRPVIYWDLISLFERGSYGKGEGERVEALRELITGAVKRRLVSDVPVGVLLSSGLDSGGIAAIVQKIGERNTASFTLGFTDKLYDESPAAGKTARYLDLTHYEHRMNVNTEDDTLRKLVALYDEPFSDTSLVAFSTLARFTAGHRKVVLSGDGADELFGGYITYTADRIHRIVSRFPRLARSGIAHVLKHIPASPEKKVSFSFKAKQFSKGIAHDYRFAHYSWRELFNERERILLIGKGYAKEIIATAPWRQFEKNYREAAHLDQNAQHRYVDMKTWLTDDILVKVDRGAMASSLEVRCPYLDPEVAACAASLSGNGRWSKKYLLKKALSPFVPRELLKRRKSGFNTPVWKVCGSDEDDNEFKAFNRFVADNHPLTGNRLPLRGRNKKLSPATAGTDCV
jgi:asparagine synthase (glutamine-hydrolysing)